MYIQFQDKVQIEISLNDSQLAQTIKNIYKHLQYVKLPYRDWDSSYYLERLTYQQLVDIFESHARAVGVPIDKAQCLESNQTYFNTLHKIYEKNYDGNPLWLNFHEHIHLCEQYKTHHEHKFLQIDYREKAGMLEKPFETSWLNLQTTVEAGDVYISWAELGKTPYDYWNNNEPDNLDRLCELAKPWLKLRPKLNIALASRDLLYQKKVKEFDFWWQQFEKPWCQYWNLSAWSLQHMYSINKIGNVLDLEHLKHQLKNQVTIIGVSLQ